MPYRFKMDTIEGFPEIDKKELWKTLFPGTDRRIMPRQFVHSIVFPFFGSVMMVPFFQSSGTAWIHQHALKRCVSLASTMELPYFRNSA